VFYAVVCTVKLTQEMSRRRQHEDASLWLWRQRDDFELFETSSILLFGVLPGSTALTLNRLIDASPAYQHGVLLPRRHAVELREHRPRQRLDGPGAWARHRRGRHRRRPLRCPRQVVSRVSRERSRARSAGCARMASQGATGGPEAGSGGVGPAGRWSPVVPGPTGVLGSPLSGCHARRQCVFHS
jgi:hypothetical protein